MVVEDSRGKKRIVWSSLWLKEDWWTMWLAGIVLVLVSVGLITNVPKLPKWSGNIAQSLPVDMIPSVLLLGISLALLTAVAVGVMKGHTSELRKYLIGFPLVFLLAVLAYVLGNETSMRHYGVNDVIWALILGLFVSNVFGKPKWLVPALRTELFIKTGLVLMGAEILFNRILSLGVYGLGVAWIVTPIVIFFMYKYGTKSLKMQDKSLVATIAACTSVCGVSAAIATGAATKAKKEEISLAISISLIFTVIMMIGLPILIRFMGLSEAVGGAWIGGTVDSTGAVVVAGSMVGQTAMEVAAVIKMLQNVLIGFVAFFFAVFFATKVEQGKTGTRPSLLEIWHRFPKFILGFILASVIFSFILIPGLGQDKVDAILSTSGILKSWLFTLAFVSIGLDSRFTDMAKVCKGGSPLKLYIVGQTFNIIITLIAAWVFFGGYFFPVVS